jgi:trk system potassium uptake protein TrkA
MRIAIAGAGNVGRAIARELIGNGHEILLIDKDAAVLRSLNLAGVQTLAADACEISALQDADLSQCQVVVAATGDDKVNLVLSLLAKTEYGVPRVVARVNHPKNEWMFDESWGVDVAVSTPRMLSALVEEAVSVGDLVRLFSFRQGEANLVEMTLSLDSPVLGKRVGALPWPPDTALVAIVRGARVIAPSADDLLDAGDELLFVSSPDQEPALQELLGHL